MTMSAVHSRPVSRSPSHGDLASTRDNDVDMKQLSSANSAALANSSYGMNQPGITFTAEPASILDFTSYPGLGPADPYDADTSTAAGSYSSIHPPSSVANSYPYQQNGYLHHQDMAHVSNSLSPLAHSNQDQFNSESYLSDPVYANYSRFTSPVMEDQGLSMLSLDENTSSTQFQSFYDNSDMVSNTSYAVHSGVPALVAPESSPTAGSHLLSSSATSNSSPAIQNEQFQSTVTNGMEPFPQITTSFVDNNQLQYGPALSGSTEHGLQQANQPIPPHMASPIDIRVENFSPEEPLEHVPLAVGPRKRSIGAKRSHLSPYDAQESSSDDDELDAFEPSTTRSTPSLVPQERNEDGSWKISQSNGQAGVSPAEREKLNQTEVPSLRELEESRRQAEKNADVEEWLSHSEVGSDADAQPKRTRRKKSLGRRRAKSFNDMQPRVDTKLALGLGVQSDYFDDSRIPGPGVYVDEKSELDDEEDDGEISGTESQESEDLQSPVAVIDADDLVRGPSAFQFEAEEANLAPTANAAIERFFTRARENDTASITATLGSRRLSESDIGSLFAARGISKPIKSKPQEKRERRPSFLQQMLPKRSNSNLLKRKGSVSNQANDPGQASPKEALSTATPAKRTSSWGIGLPRVDTNLSASSKDGASTGPGRATTSSGPFSGITKAISRRRSRSDIGKSPGLAQLMTQHGGPPMPYLASPLVGSDSRTRSPPSPSPLTAKDDSDADDFMAPEAIIMDLKVRTDPIIPTYEGFRTHARQLNPRLVEFMVDRITQEQMRRYKRLLEYRVKHANAIKAKNCPAAKFCLALGGESKILPPRASNKDGETPFIGFQVTAPGSSDEDNEALSEGTVIAAQFPVGVPLPPVKRLPAEFECPLCFKVKKFQKPSDWTKHVHEDVQPFTCTFPNCGEPKSFKRKADWVRHENERHRQLENWTCSIGDCTHTCYRKDNFVQHLVREHKLPEPRPRTGRNRGDVTPQGDIDSWSSGDPSDHVWKLVESCRHDTTKQPKDEPCRFCGNICNSWKKLTVHLAKHMEQISMPVLPLVEQKQIHADTIISPIDFPPPEKNQLPLRSPAVNPSQYNPATNGPVLTANLDPAYVVPFPPSTTLNTSIHSYPPPQPFNFNPSPTTPGGPMDFSAPQANSYAVRSYPGVSLPPKQQRSPYLNGGLHIPNGRISGNTSPQSHNSRFVPITPVSAFENQPSVFDSPVETTGFAGEPFSGSSYGPPVLQTSHDSTGNMPAFNEVQYSTSSGVPYQHRPGHHSQQANGFSQQQQQHHHQTHYQYPGQ